MKSNGESNTASPAESTPPSRAYTPKKGHATPKRKEAQNHGGSFESRFTPAESFGESRKKRKELKASMSKEEWKQYKTKAKEARKERQRATQKAMDSGDERYLMARDKGPERAFVRDLVDSKRHINSFVMPFAIVLLILMTVTSGNPKLANLVTIIAMGVMLIFITEAVTFGRKATKAVKEKFPATTEGGMSLGFYAFGRASQPRRWRTPKPRVNIGDKVE